MSQHSIFKKVCFIIGAFLFTPMSIMAQGNNRFGYPVLPDTTSASSAAVGSPVGNLSVSSMGGATYTIGIDAPVGLPDAQPQIAITYNSQSGNGMAGYGCNISGISVITRGMRDIYHDGEAKGIGYTINDAFYLDGQRMIRLSYSEGGDSAVFCLDSDPYIRIVAYAVSAQNGSGLWFRATSKDGRRYEYGTSNSSVRSDNNNNRQYSDAWYLTKSTSPNGNYIEYGYFRDNLCVYPSYIEYGHNERTANPLGNQIEFSYESRNDIHFFAVHDKRGCMLRRLKEIACKTGNVLFRKYSLAYDDTSDESSTKFSRLITINEQNGSNETLKPIVLSWQHLQAFTPSVQSIPFDITRTENSYISTIVSGSSQLFAADLNNDGISDIIHKASVQYIPNNGHIEGRSVIYTYKSQRDANGNVTYRSVPEYSFLPANAQLFMWNNWTEGPIVCDFNGDGKNDVFIPNIVTGEINYIEFFYMENGGNYNYNIPPSISYIMQNNSSVPLYTCCDIDKDGRSDLIVLENEKNGDCYEVCIFQGGSQCQNPDTIRTRFSMQGKPKKIFTSDYNSDGLPDLMVVHDSGYRIIWNQGGNLTASALVAGADVLDSYLGDAYRIYEGDFNGDGLADYLIAGENSPTWYFYLDNGDGTFDYASACTLPNIYKTGNSEEDGKYFTCLVYDMDGDGMSDVLISKAKYSLSGSYMQVHTCWLTSNGYCLAIKKELTSSNKEDASVNYYMLGDFNGDGLAEAANYGYNCYWGGALNTQLRTYANQNYSPTSGKIASIANGYGKATDITYGTLTDPAIYEKGTGASYPVVDCILPIHAVSGIIENKGTEYADTINFAYGKLKFQVAGKGLLGFGKTIRQDHTLSEAGVQEVTLNMESYTPSLITETKYVGSDVATIVTNYSRVQPHVGKKSYYYYPTSSTETDLDGNEFYRTYSYNFNKNAALTEMQTTHSDGYTKTQYQNFVKRYECYLPTKVITQTKYTGQGVFTETQDVAYNLYGQKTRQTDRYGTNAQVNKHLTYDSFGNVLSSITSATGTNVVRKTYQYDTTHRFVTRQTEPLCTVVFTHDLWGNVLTKNDITRPNTSLTTNYTYDGWGNLLSEQTATGQLTTYVRGWSNDGGSFVVCQGTGMPWKKDCFDVLGRKKSVQSISSLNLPIEETFQYGLRGELLEHIKDIGTYPYCLSFAERYTYDTRGRMKSSHCTGKPDVNYSYAPNAITETENGQSVEKRLDLWGNVVQVTDEAGIVNYHYGSHGHPTSTSFDGKTITMGYDDVGRQISLSDPDAGTMTYTYDSFDRVISECDAQGHLTENTYNEKGQMTETTTDGIVTTNAYGSTGTGRYLLLSSVRGNCSVSYTYDIFGRVATERRAVMGGDTLETHYSYNAIGQLAAKEYVNGPTVSYTYDAYGCTNEIRANGTLISKPYENTGETLAVKSGDNLMRERWLTDNACTLELSLSGGNITGLDNDIYCTYDTETHSIDYRQGMFPWSEYFTYDSLDRLTSVSGNGTEETRYAPNGNITYKTGIGRYFYESDKPHAVTLVENTGNKISLAPQATVFNAFGKIESVSENASNCSMQFTYGPDNERWKTRQYKNGLLFREIYYMGDCEKIVQQGHTRRLYFLDNGAIYVKQDNHPDSIYFTFTDQLGSIVAIVDYEGNELFKTAYDAWGQPTVYRNDINFHRGYCGHEMLPEFGLINMNGRLYDPLLGRFLSCDNFVQEPYNSQNFNRYSYCLNNPLKYCDPDGEFAWMPILIGAIMGGGLGGLTYTSTMLLPNSSWDTSNFLKSVGVGAMSGALSAASSQLSTLAPAGTVLNKFTSSFGYKLLSQTTNSIITNTIFGNKTSLSQISGIVASAAFNSVLPDYDAGDGSWLENIAKEMGNNIINGLASGIVQGTVQASVDGNTDIISQCIISNTLSAFTRTAIMDILMGAPVKKDIPGVESGLYRQGGLFSLFNRLSNKYGGGLTLGRNMWVNPTYPYQFEVANNILLYHEYCHVVQQQANNGWTGFYSKYLYEVVKCFFSKLPIYKTEGTLDYEADQYYKLFIK